MDVKDESDLEHSNRYRKFGLPNWMVNNIERLNFVTDFEQYACSPPETEGFLSEHLDNCDYLSPSEPYCPVVSPNDPVEEKPNRPVEIKVDVEPNASNSNLLTNAAEQASSPVLSNLKHDEMFSSPDTTPCATPEPSPAPRRRMSGQQDSVQTNPGKWFYLGPFKKTDQNNRGHSMNVDCNKENQMKYLDKTSDAPQRIRDSQFQPKKDTIKLVISNFDINAISPSSW